MKKILVGSLIFVALYNLFFFPTVFGIGIGLLFLFFHIYIFTLRNEKSPYIQLAIVLSTLSIIFATLLGLRANISIVTIDLLLAIFLTVVAGYFYKTETLFPFTIASLVFLPFSILSQSIKSIGVFFLENKIRKHSQTHAEIYKAILRGVIIAIPILFVLFLLLSGADPIFKMITSTISFSVSIQLIISILIFVLCFVWGITSIKNDKEKTESFLASNQKLPVESLIVTWSAAILFAVFISIQIRYLFLQVPETELHKLGINIQTYSDYVRQGFFQLLIAAAIATSIIAFILQYFHTNIIKHKFYLKIAMLLLTIETEFLLLSAGKRLYLYEQAHGLTQSRFLGIIFLIWLSTILIFLFIAVLKNIKKPHAFAAMTIITVSAFAVLNFVSMDFLIAKYYPPTINKEIDYSYIMSLSPDAATAWPEFIVHAQNSWKTLSTKQHPSDDDVRKTYELQSALAELNGNLYYLDRKYTKFSKNYIPIANETGVAFDNDISSEKTWQAFNLSEYQAYMLIQKNRQLFFQIKPLIEDISKKQTVWSHQQ